MREKLYITFHSEDEIRQFVDSEDRNGCEVSFGNAFDEDGGTAGD